MDIHLESSVQLDIPNEDGIFMLHPILLIVLTPIHFFKIYLLDYLLI